MKLFMYLGALTSLTLRGGHEATLVPHELVELPEESDFVSSLCRRGMLREPTAEELAGWRGPAGGPSAPSSRKPKGQKSASKDVAPKTLRGRRSSASSAAETPPAPGGADAAAAEGQVSK